MAMDWRPSWICAELDARPESGGLLGKTCSGVGLTEHLLASSPVLCSQEGWGVALPVPPPHGPHPNAPLLRAIPLALFLFLRIRKAGRGDGRQAASVTTGLP
jgi:hypothetical protein